MSTRTCGLLWRTRVTLGHCQLMTSTKDRFIWTHGFKDNSKSRVFKSTEDLSRKITIIQDNLTKGYAYWIGPEEMSGWEDDN